MIISQTNANGILPPLASDVSMPQKPAVPDTNSTSAVHAESPAKAVQGAEAALGSEQVKQSVDHLNKLMLSLNNDLRFSVDQDTGIKIVKVVDSKTNDVITQLPSKEAVAIAKALDTLQGMLIRQKA